MEKKSQNNEQERKYKWHLNTLNDAQPPLLKEVQIKLQRDIIVTYQVRRFKS